MKSLSFARIGLYLFLSIIATLVAGVFKFHATVICCEIAMLFFLILFVAKFIKG